MRAMLLDQPRPAEQRPLRLADLPTPTPGPGEVRVRVNYCALCHTDLHIVEGDLPLPRLPLVPGHQIVGIVDDLGAGATLHREGDRVGIPWLYSTDGTCPYCRSGRENLCENARFTGLHADGGYAEHTVIGESFCYPLPKSFDDIHAAPLLCAGIVGYRSFKLSTAKRGDRLGLYGFGASAHLVIQVAVHLGCEVYVFTRAQAHRDLARKLGAAWTGDARDTPPAPLDCSILFAPVGWIVLEALRVTRRGGTVACAGVTMSPIPEMDYRLLYHERVLLSIANATRQDAREFLDIAAAIPVRTEVELFKLEELNDALVALKHSRIEAAAVVKVAD
jgi:alcohol dehydrogenase, propanol-preferring